MSTPTYGPDMFAMDQPYVDPQTILNEPLPRAWSQGGIIESVKRAVVTGVRDGFAAGALNNNPDQDESYYIDIEYPTDVTKYPGLWVQFSIEQLTRTGLAMATWTKGEDGVWGEIQTWSFNGRITLTIAALSAKDRDRLADAVIAQLAFSRPPDMVLRNPAVDAQQFKGLLTSLDDNPYVSVTLNTDQVNSGGQSTSSGVPWASNVLLYEDSYSVGCHGQFNMRFRYDGVYELSRVDYQPTMGDQLPIPPPPGAQNHFSYPIGSPGQPGSMM